MAENMPVNFPIPGESAIATYDYADVVSGLGYQNFYTFQTVIDSGGVETAYPQLSSELIPSNYNATLISTGGTLVTNFDTSSFNSPRTLKGRAYFSCTGTQTVSTGGRVDFKLQKVSGATVTDICSTTGTSDFTTSNQFHIVHADLTETHLAIGDILRLVITLVRTAGTLTITVDGGADTATARIPFKIEL